MTQIEGHIAWLDSLAKKGGKGRVHDVDARALGRIAKEIESLREDNQKLRDILKNEREWMARDIDEMRRYACAMIEVLK